MEKYNYLPEPSDDEILDKYTFYSVSISPTTEAYEDGFKTGFISSDMSMIFYKKTIKKSELKLELDNLNKKNVSIEFEISKALYSTIQLSYISEENGVPEIMAFHDLIHPTEIYMLIIW